MIGIALITMGFLGLLVSLTSFTMWGYPMWPGVTGPMMGGGWSYSELVEVSGTVEKIEWMEIELEVGEEVEVHGPP